MPGIRNGLLMLVALTICFSSEGLVPLWRAA
jgi:hypothetical protein